MLIFPANLEEVEEVCGGRVNGYKVLGWRGNWIGEARDCELLRSLSCELVHREGQEPILTFTYSFTWIARIILSSLVREATGDVNTGS